MFKIPKQEYTAEFKTLATKQGKLNAPGGKAVTAEQMELSRVSAENARLRMENEIVSTVLSSTYNRLS